MTSLDTGTTMSGNVWVLRGATTAEKGMLRQTAFSGGRTKTRLTCYMKNATASFVSGTAVFQDEALRIAKKLIAIAYVIYTLSLYL
jgi:hypothetical protein